MRIIPSYIEDKSPPGERLVFSGLQNSTKNWIAIHSLDLAPYNKNRRTEIDFVLIMPEHGIFCIEVKSQKKIFFDSVRWHPESIKNSPFKQALDARFAFRRRLIDKMKSKYKNFPVLHCCIFPLSDFSFESNLSINFFEVMDRQLFNSCKTPDEFCRTIAQMFTCAVDNDPLINKLSKPIDSEDVDNIVDFCYPVQKRKPEKSEEIKQRQIKLDNLFRVQQKPVLNLVAHNDRVLVEGGAGTGKSLIGMEVAIRKAEEGLRVGYLCFNQLIGKWNNRQLDNCTYPNLVSGTIHSVLIQLMDINVPDNVDSFWWDNDLPSIVEEKLTSPDLSNITTFDYLVIDEAQDILARPALWNCLKLFLNNSFERGKFLILGDFINQSLTRNQYVVDRSLHQISSISARWLLFENCRNYRPIGEVALKFSASDKDTWSGYMRGGGRLDDWDLIPYTNDTEQVEKLLIRIQQIKNSGFKDSDITLLTFCSIKKSIIKSLVNRGTVMEKASVFDSPYLRYSTINSYKGMENKIIIITDVVLSPQNIELERKIFYTGMTRATENLFILCRDGSMKILHKWVLDQGK